MKFKDTVFYCLFLAFSPLWAVIPAILVMAFTHSIILAFIAYVFIIWKASQE